MVKSLPAVQWTRVQSLGWENALEKRMATQFSILARRIPWSLVGYSLRGRKELDTSEQLTHSLSFFLRKENEVWREAWLLHLLVDGGEHSHHALQGPASVRGTCIIGA